MDKAGKASIGDNDGTGAKLRAFTTRSVLAIWQPARNFWAAFQLADPY